MHSAAGGKKTPQREAYEKSATSRQTNAFAPSSRHSSLSCSQVAHEALLAEPRRFYYASLPQCSQTTS